DSKGTAVEGAGRAPRFCARRRPWRELSRHAHLTMSGRIARQLVRLYPRAWRARYEAEFIALLDARDLDWRDAADIALGLPRDWLRVRWVAMLFGLPLTMWAMAFAWTVGFAAVASLVVGGLRWAVGLDAPFKLWFVSSELIVSLFLGMP